MRVVYDAGALIAAEQSNRQLWADHRARLESGFVPTTTAPVVAQVSRSGRQVQLRRFLRGCEVVPFAEPDAHQVGSLAGKSKHPDVVDVHLVWVASKLQAKVITSDRKDISKVIDALAAPMTIDPI